MKYWCEKMTQKYGIYRNSRGACTARVFMESSKSEPGVRGVLKFWGLSKQVNFKFPKDKRWGWKRATGILITI